MKNAILIILGGVDGPTAARLLAEAQGHLRAAIRAATRLTVVPSG